jgi:hypothetical protein
MRSSVDSFAKRSGLWLGTMFFFAAILQLIALCCACRLPKDKANSKKVGETNNNNNNNNSNEQQ